MPGQHARVVLPRHCICSCNQVAICQQCVTVYRHMSVLLSSPLSPASFLLSNGVFPQSTASSLSFLVCLQSLFPILPHPRPTVPSMRLLLSPQWFESLCGPAAASPFPVLHQSDCSQFVFFYIISKPLKTHHLTHESRRTSSSLEPSE
jgi:hypothetical protein